MKKLLKLFALSTVLVLLLSACSNDSNTPEPAAPTEPTLPTEPGTNALSSLRKLGDGVFALEYEGDYCLDDIIASDSKTDSELLAYFEESIPEWKTYKENGSPVTINLPAGFACSSIAAANADSCGGQIYGRNYDWTDSAILLIHTKPYNGYESISTSCLSFVNLPRNWNPDTDGESAKLAALTSVHVPIDGMNEKGLYISVLVAGDHHQTNQNTDKHDVTTTVAMRYVLDKAANVDEAINLLKSIDMYSVLGYAFHFAIADNTGKSVVVEWYNNVMYTTETPVVTNHYLTEGGIAGATANNSNYAPTTGIFGSQTRYDTLTDLHPSTASLTQAQVAAGLQGAAQISLNPSSTFGTLWSVVFEPNKRRATYYFRLDYTKPVVVEF